ncbi:MAG: hypothetical protein KJ052_18840 [Candidatus Hydrogenedentes bacterium]|nr:hypothetical protein [Candidatus Hydrogenedentota bacterium]
MPNEFKAPDQSHHTRRDAETLFLLGIFVTVLSIAVLIGTFFAHRQHAAIVNVCAGTVLLLVGLGFTWRGWSVKRGLDNKS